MAVSRQEVIDCYRYIAGREPESENVILWHMEHHKTLLDCYRSFYDSPEYKRRHPGLTSFSRVSSFGGIETIGLWEEPATCLDGMKANSILEIYHNSVRDRKPCVMVTDVDNRFMGKILLKEGVFPDGTVSFLNVPNHIEVGSSSTWRSEVWRIWDAWHIRFPNIPCAPLTQNGKLLGCLHILHSDMENHHMNVCMDIDQELYKLIVKYGIYREEPELLEYYYERYASVYLNELLDHLPKRSVIAFDGASDDTQAIIDRLTPYNRQKISYVIDDEKVDLANITCLTLSESHMHNINVIICSTYASKEITKKLIREQKAFIMVIDPYDFLRIRGIIVSGGLPVEKGRFQAKTYVDINNALYAFENCKEEEKDFYLRRLIAYCVHIKNFVYMEKYIKLYMERGYALKELYDGFISNFYLLIERIKKRLSERIHEDIIVNWVDATNSKEFYSTPFAESLKGKALFFNKAYTNTPWTHYTYKNIFFEKLPITGKTFAIKEFNLENSKILSMLKEHGYDFKFIANPGVYQEEFPIGSKVLYVDGHVSENLTMERGLRECSSRLQWMALGERLKVDRPLLIWIHNLTETHYPYTIISTKKLFTGCESHLRGLDFLQEQLFFYSKFRNDRQHDIYLSDHGCHDDGDILKPWGEDLSHIAMIVRSPKVKAGSLSKLYSHVNFNQIINKLLEMKVNVNLNEACTDYVIGENPDYQGLNQIQRNINLNELDLSLYQYVCVRTEEDVYIRYVLLGKELYYRGDDEENNLIDAPEWQNRIEYLRSISPKNFIDIYKEPAFKESYRLYDFVKTIPAKEFPWYENVNKKEEII